MTDTHIDKHYGDPTTGSTAYIGLIGSLIFVLTIIYLEALFYESEEQEIQTKFASQEVDPVDIMQAEQADILAGYNYFHDYADGEGRVTIPVTDAVDKLLAEWPNSGGQANAGATNE